MAGGFPPVRRSSLSNSPEAVIRPHVSNLRRKLKQAGQDEDLITNVRGIGYRLSEQVD